MTESYQLKTDYFAGPIQALFELIVKKKLDITELSLSEVTADFLAYVGTLRDVSPSVLADFIVVASRLILIKSKALLPDMTLAEEEESQIYDLELRLLLYKECKTASAKVNALWNRGRIEYSRELFWNYQLGVFYPPPQLKIVNLEESLQALLKTLAAFELHEKNLLRGALIAIEEKMTQLMDHLSKERRSRFSILAKNKDEMIALFLAVLHLLKDRAIEIEQGGAFSDIIIRPAEKR